MDRAFSHMKQMCSLVPKCPAAAAAARLAWLWLGPGTQSRRRAVAVSSLLSQALPALLAPRASSAGKLQLNGATTSL